MYKFDGCPKTKYVCLCECISLYDKLYVSLFIDDQIKNKITRSSDIYKGQQCNQVKIEVDYRLFVVVILHN